MLERFRETFGLDPTVVCSAPGRVNLIGEHTDYSLLPVLPMAISQRVTVAAASSEDGFVRAISLNHPEDGGWQRYVDAAVAVVGLRADRGARLLVASDLPSTGGLSSSSALTVAVVAALGRLWGRSLDTVGVVESAVVAERATGVAGGTMDQNVIVRGRPGHALRIDFLPERFTNIALPERVCFVAGYSGSPAPKGTTARAGYNARVVGSRCSAALLGTRLGLDAGTPPLLGRLANVDGVLAAAGELPRSASPIEVASTTGRDIAELSASTDASVEQALPLRRWAHHVLTEAARVDAVEAAIRSSDLAALGELLDESHVSLTVDFGVGTAGLDRVVEAARSAGAAGARLTGAGFGGWAVAVCSVERTEAVVAAMRRIGGQSFRAMPSPGLTREDAS